MRWDGTRWGTRPLLVRLLGGRAKDKVPVHGRLQAYTMFPHWVLPPWAFGRMWSKVRSQRAPRQAHNLPAACHKPHRRARRIFVTTPPSSLRAGKPRNVFIDVTGFVSSCSHFGHLLLSLAKTTLTTNSMLTFYYVFSRLVSPINPSVIQK